MGSYLAIGLAVGFLLGFLASRIHQGPVHAKALKDAHTKGEQDGWKDATFFFLNMGPAGYNRWHRGQTGGHTDA